MSLNAFVASLAGAIKTKTSLPKFPSGITVTEAYSLIPQLMEHVSAEGAAGLKAGITNKDLQALFGLDEPLL